MDDHDPITQKALFRYQIISGYLASDPPWGKRRLILEQLAAKPWMLQNQIALQAIIRAAIRKVDKID